MRRGVQILIPGLILLLGLALQIADPSFVVDLRGKMFDILQRIEPRPYADAPVRIVDLDDESLSRLGQWPWPRTLVAQLIHRLSEAGAAAIAFDIVFAEPDRTSPAQIIPLWPSTPEVEALRARLDSLPDHDLLLAEAIRQNFVVTGFVLTNDAGGREPAAKAGFAVAGDDDALKDDGALKYVPSFTGAVVPIEPIDAASAGSGSFNLIAEHDGIVRRAPMILGYGGSLRPSLAAEALRVAQGASSYVVKLVGASGLDVFTTQVGVAELKIGQFVARTDESGQILLYDTGPVPQRVIPAWRVLGAEFDPETINGRIVLVGTSAAGLKDLRATPLNPVAAGVEVHAQVIEQIISGTFLTRPSWTKVAEIAFVLLLGAVLIYAEARFGALWGGAVALSWIIVTLLATWRAFVDSQLMIAPVLPIAIIIAVYISASVTSYLKAERDRRQVRDAFSHYMSPVMVARLAANPSQLRLGGERREMTILFSDMRGFTTISEHLRDDPEQLTFVINSYFTKMTDRILEYAGTIDKYMGDAVMAFWNAPLTDLEHARHACHAALEMLDGLTKLNHRLKEQLGSEDHPFEPIEIGVGLNTGTCLVGNLGSEHRFSYSVLGDPVNLASRLEAQSKTYGVTIIIGETTQQQAADFATLEIDLIQVKGKHIPSRIYALLGLPRVHETDAFRTLESAHNDMLAAYREQDWRRAEEHLARCRALGEAFGLSTLYALYAARISSFRDVPPPANWDGVYVARSK